MASGPEVLKRGLGPGESGRRISSDFSVSLPFHVLLLFGPNSAAFPGGSGALSPKGPRAGSCPRVSARENTSQRSQGRRSGGRGSFWAPCVAGLLAFITDLRAATCAPPARNPAGAPQSPLGFVRERMHWLGLTCLGLNEWWPAVRVAPCPPLPCCFSVPVGELFPQAGRLAPKAAGPRGQPWRGR